MKYRSGVVLLISILALSGNLQNRALAQDRHALDSKTVEENRELDRQLLAAHERKDSDMLLSLFSKSPDTFFIAPNGAVNKGLGAIRQSYDRFFAGLQWIRGEIKEVSYLPAADGVIAVGTVIFHRQPRNGSPEERTVVWTDFRRKENGKWVYLFRHAHWPTQPEK